MPYKNSVMTTYNTHVLWWRHSCASMNCTWCNTKHIQIPNTNVRFSSQRVTDRTDSSCHKSVENTSTHGITVTVLKRGPHLDEFNTPGRIVWHPMALIIIQAFFGIGATWFKSHRGKTTAQHCNLNQQTGFIIKNDNRNIRCYSQINMLSEKNINLFVSRGHFISHFRGGKCTNKMFATSALFFQLQHRACSQSPCFLRKWNSHFKFMDS